MTAYDPAANGWRALPGAAMPAGLGVPWAKKHQDRWHYGLLTGPEHANPNGVIHGGVMMAFADHGLSFLAWEAAERAPCTTIQLNTHFLDATKPGEFIELRGEVTRRARGLVFVAGRIVAHQSDQSRDVGAVDGIWRVLRPPLTFYIRKTRPISWASGRSTQHTIVQPDFRATEKDVPWTSIPILPANEASSHSPSMSAAHG